MDSDFTGLVNIGSEEMVTINQLPGIVMSIAEKEHSIRHIEDLWACAGGILKIA